jgi:prepilin-type N-terminal cleavage/methylation domain-containing protein
MSIIPPSKKSGFTLIEIVIVLAIAALIMVIVFVAVQGALSARRNDQRRSDARRVLAAMESRPDLYADIIRTQIDAPRNTALNILTRSLLGVTTFEDPTQTYNQYSTIDNTGTSRNYLITYRPSSPPAISPATEVISPTFVAPLIEISNDAKCRKIGNYYKFETSPGSNAVIVILEPFRTTRYNLITDPEPKYQTYGTPYCINT